MGGGFLPARFFLGAGFAAGGVAFTVKHRRLLAWSLVPMLVQVALFVGLLVGGLALLEACWRFLIIFTRPAVALGFGAAGWLMSHLPLTYPFLVVGGTRLHLALAAWDRLDSDLTEPDEAALRRQPRAAAAQ